MIGTGLFVKCERCGKEETFLDTHNKGDGEIKFYNSNWSRVENKDVCPECKAEYDARMKKFFNEYWDK